MSAIAGTPVLGARIPESTPATTTSGTLRAPLYVAWQVTNECNLACMHCIEESGPGKAFKDELSDEQKFDMLRQIVEADVPYMSFSGGEPMMHPRFFDMVDYVCQGGIQLKIETNGHYLTEEACIRMKDAGVKAVQVSMDGASKETFSRMRIHGDFDAAIAGMRTLTRIGVPLEINYSPTGFNAHEIGTAIDLAAEIGAESFYTGRTMYTGNAVKTWRKLNPTEEQYEVIFETLYAKAAEYEGRMRVHFHEMGLLEELRYRLDNPAALLIVLPNGLVKLINALPFVCGDLRQESLEQIWGNFQRAWQNPKVAAFVDDMAANPDATALLHKWVRV